MNNIKPKKTVIKIPATKDNVATDSLEEIKQKTRVCAYARVSTELDEQQNSYEAQIKYYKDFINKNPNWEFVDIYADEGISGTSTKHRESFNRMIDDAKAGKIDMILTKSISRFARNTLDTIRITRELKAIGVEVYFEKENLKSMDPTTEVQLTILSSLAQDESRSLSQNVRWGQERRMQEGKFTVAWSHFLGYDKGPDGLPVINEEEAKIVRTIYDLYISGKTAGYIANYLTERNIPTPSGKSKWNTGTILRILQNEKYKGDAKIHKTYTVDYLTKEVRENNGEVSQYYVTNSHPAIIDRATHDLVQEMIKERAKKSSARSNKYYFNGKLFCAKCGNAYERKARQKNGHEYVSWNCCAKYGYKKYRLEPCESVPAYEPELRNGYITAMNELLAKRGELLAKYGEEISALSNRGARDKLAMKIDKLEDKLDETNTKFRNLLLENVRKHEEQEYYRLREQYQAEIRIAEEKLEQAKKKARDNNIKLIRLKQLKSVLDIYSSKLLAFDEQAFMNSIEKVMIADTHLDYIFLDGTKVRIARAERRGSHDPENI